MSLAPPRVLVVEDTPTVADLVVSILETVSIDAESVGTGREALEHLEAGGGGYDMVVLDLGLPDTSGARLLETIHARWPSLPVLVMTGGTDRPPVAHAYVRKPFDMSDFLAQVRRLVPSASATGPLDSD